MLFVHQVQWSFFGPYMSSLSQKTTRFLYFWDARLWQEQIFRAKNEIGNLNQFIRTGEAVEEVKAFQKHY